MKPNTQVAAEVLKYREQKSKRVEENKLRWLQKHFGTGKRGMKIKDSKEFYRCGQWREVRYKALVRDGGVCCACGRSKKDGVTLHVDHIKPRMKFPHLQYDLNNLQTLCEDCNIGKSDKDVTDWR